MLSIFFPPLPLILSLFSFAPSLPPCRRHKVCHIHWTIPAFSSRPHRLGSRSKTELPLAQPRASPPCRQSGRLPAPKIHEPHWSRSKQRELSQNKAEEGRTSKNEHVLICIKKKQLFPALELCYLGLNFSSKMGNKHLRHVCMKENFLLEKTRDGVSNKSKGKWERSDADETQLNTSETKSQTTLWPNLKKIKKIKKQNRRGRRRLRTDVVGQRYLDSPPINLPKFKYRVEAMPFCRNTNRPRHSDILN